MKSFGTIEDETYIEENSKDGKEKGGNQVP